MSMKQTGANDPVTGVGQTYTPENSVTNDNTCGTGSTGTDWNST